MGRRRHPSAKRSRHCPPTGFDVESQTVRGGIRTPPTSSMTLFFAHADSRSPKDHIPHASHRYNHCQSASGSQLLQLSTNPILLAPAPLSIQQSISSATVTRGPRNAKEKIGEAPQAPMNVVHSTHQFADAATAQIQNLRRCVLLELPPLLSSPQPQLCSSVSSNTSLIMVFYSDHCQLIIRQGPENARVAVGKEKGTPASSEHRCS